MNVIKEINQINQRELENGYVNTSASWHAKYAKSAWVYIGNLPTQLTEGDVLSVMSQFGEIEDINLVREESTGKSKGFCFVKYEDARSCILAVDNFNGSRILQRSMRVDHVENYRLPKHLKEKEEELAAMKDENGALEAGHMYKDKELENRYDISKGQDLFASVEETEKEEELEQRRRDKEVRKKERDLKRQEKAERKERREEKRRMKRERKMAKEEKSLKKSKTDKKKHRRKRYDSDDEEDDNSASE